MLLLFNKTIKPLNQLAKTIQKKSLFLGLLLMIFNPFCVYSMGNRQKEQQHLQRKAHNKGKRYKNNFNTAY